MYVMYIHHMLNAMKRPRYNSSFKKSMQPTNFFFDAFLRNLLPILAEIQEIAS